MTDVAELKAAIARVGIQKVEIAKALGLTYGGLWKKMRGLSEFKASEIKKLQKLLGLSDEQRDDIFFASKRD
jgi:hypothetical protein